MAFNPKVTIGIPVYNGSDYMREAIDSALCQTYQNVEVIVVNDGSNDSGRTEAIALSYGSRIRFFSKENGGVATALNMAIFEMTGDYFSWLSHDDVYVPEKIARQVHFLDLLTDRNVVLWSDFVVINSKSAHIDVVKIDSRDTVDIRRLLIAQSSLHGCTLLIPKVCFDTVGLFREDLKTTQDYALWFKMAGKYRFVHMDDILVRSRIHANQGSRTIPTHGQEKESLFISFLDEYLECEMVRQDREIIFKRYVEFANALLRRGLLYSSLHALRTALGSTPSPVTAERIMTYMGLAQYMNGGIRLAVKSTKKMIRRLVKV